MGLKRLCFLIVLSLLLFFGCATNPATKKYDFVLMSEQQELDIGKKMAPEIAREYGIYESDSLQQYVNSVGQSIAESSDRPDLFYRFTVLNSPIVNAFALPGGYIFITRGLIAYMNSEAELSGVLAHEISHVTARHSVRQYTKAVSYQVGTGIASIFMPEAANFSNFMDLAFTTISSGYSRAYETEADMLALRYAETAGYDACAIGSMLKTLNLLDRYSGGEKTHTSLFATHPETEKRIADVNNKTLCANVYENTSNSSRLKYLENLEGLVFGDDPREGIIVGNKFTHPDLKMELLFPVEWKINNMPQAVIATDKKEEAFIEFNLYNLSKKMSVDEAETVIAEKLGLRKISGDRKTVKGLKAYVGTYSVKTQGLGNVSLRMGFFLQNDKVFYVNGYTKTENFKNVVNLFEKTINSFRILSPKEIKNVHPNRISLYKVKRGDTLSLIIKKLKRPKGDLKNVALINAWDPEKLPALKTGMIIKVIK
jgi:predicted Zn-dependent protease